MARPKAANAAPSSSAVGMDTLGPYRIEHEGTRVKAEKGKDSLNITELSEGTIVNVVEIETMHSEERIRARIEDPAGWISLEDTTNGYRWAVKAVLEVAVCNLSGTILLNAELPTDASVIHLREKLTKAGEKEDLELCFEGKELHDDRTLAAYGVKSGDAIDIVRVKKEEAFFQIATTSSDIYSPWHN